MKAGCSSYFITTYKNNKTTDKHENENREKEKDREKKKKEQIKTKLRERGIYKYLYYIVRKCEYTQIGFQEHNKMT